MIDFFKNGVHLLLTFIYTVLAWIQPRGNTFCTEGGAVMLQAHCYHVAIMLLVFCEHGTNMLQVCCQHVESMLSARCQQLQSMLPTFAKHVASMHRACAEHLQIKQPCPAARTEEFSVLFLPWLQKPFTCYQGWIFVPKIKTVPQLDLKMKKISGASF